MGTFIGVEGVFLNYISVSAKKRDVYVSVICKTDMRKTMTENYIFS